MPLFRVEITVEAVIEAADARDAEYDGFDALKDEIGNMDYSSVTVTPLKSLSDLPAGWSRGSLIYGTDEDTTVAEALAAAKETP
jgi:hypothetical protein